MSPGASEKREDTAFDNRVMTSMPRFIAIAYRKMLTAEDAEAKARAAREVFDLMLRAAAIDLISQYVFLDTGEMRTVSHHELNQLIIEELPKGDLHTWFRVFFTALRAYKGVRDRLFITELYDFFWDITSFPYTPYVEREQLFSRLVELANDIHQSEGTVKSFGWQVVCDEFSKLLKKVFGYLAFLEKYELVRVVSPKESGYLIERHVGLEITEHFLVMPQDKILRPGWFYLTKNQQEFLQLDPLLIFWEGDPSRLTVADTGRDIGVYQHYHEGTRQLEYLAIVMGLTLPAQEHLRDFEDLIFTIKKKKQPKVAISHITWFKLQDSACDISSRRMAVVSGKYRPQTYLQRENVRKAFYKFLDRDDMRGFVLVGKSGVGKSSFLLDLAKELEIRPDIAVLMYDGALLDPQTDITESITQDFRELIQLTDRRIRDIWNEIVEIDDIEQKRVLLCIDAINENSDPEKLLRQIDQLVQKPWSWLKILVTSRPTAWEQAKRRVRLAESLYYRDAWRLTDTKEVEEFSYSLELEPFSARELPKVYEKYQRALGLLTSYEELSNDMKTALTDPLMLYIVTRIYEGNEIPYSIKTGDIIPQYEEWLLKHGILVKESIALLEKDLMPLMLKEGGPYLNKITSANIAAIDEKLFDRIYSAGRYSTGQRVNEAFLGLLDAEILMETDSFRHREIRFKYERFYDYYAGRQLSKLLSNRPKAETVDEIIRQKVPYLRGAIENALLIELQGGQEGSQLLLDLAHTADEAVKELVSSTLRIYSRDAERSGQLEIILRKLIADGKGGLGLPDGIARRVASTGGRAANNAKKIAIEVATSMGLEQILLYTVRDDSSTIRMYTLRHIFYLWRDGRQDKVLGLLDRLSFDVTQGVGRLQIPNAKLLEVFAGTIFLIFFNDRGAWPQLQKRCKQAIDNVFWIKGERTRRWGGIAPRIRDFAISAVINLATGLLGQQPRHASDMPEMLEFFDLPPDRNRLLGQVLDCFEMSANELESNQHLLIEALTVNNIFIAFVVELLLCAKGSEDMEVALRLIPHIFDEISDLSPTSPACVILLGCLQQLTKRNLSKSAIPIHDRMLRRWLDATGGEIRAKRSYRVNCFWGRATMYQAALGTVDISLMHEYIEKAMKESDEEFLITSIWESGFLITYSRLPSVALQAIEPLLIIEQGKVHTELVNLLARARVSFPDEVDSFLFQNNVSPEFRTNVWSTEAREDIGGDLLWLGVGDFLFDAVALPEVQPRITYALRKAMGFDKGRKFLDWLAK